MDKYVFGEYDSEYNIGLLQTDIDIVYCIDLTQTMVPLIKRIQETVSVLPYLIQKKLFDQNRRNVRHLRTKIIGFRDIYADGDYAFEISPFFRLPDEADKFADFVNGLEAKGGGDIPENGLEALAMAMQTDWCKTDDENVGKRHIIVLFTDAPAHPLEKSANYSGKNYPENMPKTYAELIDMWYGQGSCANGSVVTIDHNAAQLAIFAPENSEPWVNIADDFDWTIFQDIEGDRDFITDEIVSMIYDYYELAR